jgi:hypothetical protein
MNVAYDGHETLMHNVFKVNSMILVLRHNVKTGKPKEIIELYYQEMGKGACYSEVKRRSHASLPLGMEMF